MRRLAPLLFLLCSSLTAQSQVRTVEVRTPRPFGYFLGDLVRAQVDIVVEPGFALQAASLPQPGAITYWLDLRTVAVTQASEGGGSRVRLDLTYQNFYAALDARALEIPGFTVTFVSDTDKGATTAKAQVPPWSFNISPLREVQPPAREDPRNYLRPDGRVASLDTQPLVVGSAGFMAMALLAFAGLAWDRTWWPFAKRGGRAFAACLRRLRALAGRGEDEAAYETALLALHRALDETDGRRVLADDLPAFLTRNPAYARERAGLAAFLDASRHSFFGPGPAGAMRRLPLADIVALTRKLTAIERES
ncbi:nonribosomal peptide synthetase MxaA [Methylobacterium sp. WL19]|uniref:nonribosomal peptide synthetase MxaA n=1 Tax=Methylobacterium sp. WL19 TaxID=2603896 RepID=UPI0011C77A1C|nr:nonribosomal peptide synthetase MxaA [Methylobacterium sp. WL19]TXN33304.1 nonribosomal peptide synthetase MxaA [Methylobacterium sp. WL19]